MFNFDFSSISAVLEQLYKSSYDAGFYNKETIAGFVKGGSIGPDAYKRITGDDYVKAQATTQS